LNFEEKIQILGPKITTFEAKNNHFRVNNIGWDQNRNKRDNRGTKKFDFKIGGLFL
jgi:hypothetical protein